MSAEIQGFHVNAGNLDARIPNLRTYKSQTNSRFRRGGHHFEKRSHRL